MSRVIDPLLPKKRRKGRRGDWKKDGDTHRMNLRPTSEAAETGSALLRAHTQMMINMSEYDDQA